MFFLFLNTWPIHTLSLINSLVTNKKNIRRLQLIHHSTAAIESGKSNRRIEINCHKTQNYLKLTYHHLCYSGHSTRASLIHMSKSHSMSSKHAKEWVILNQLPMTSPSLAGTAVYAHFPIISPATNKKEKKEDKKQVKFIFFI